MPPTSQQAEAAQAVYTPRMLAVYDVAVLALSNRYLWKCSTPRLLAHYNEHISGNHLDVGVGTGYFLDRCRFPAAAPRVALMDMNAHALAFASRRIARYSPEIYRQNVLEKISTPIAPFDSVGVNYLLHCLPGTMAEKTVAFDRLQAVMKPGARIFGSTILRRGVPCGWIAGKLMAYYNNKAIFSNTEDDLEGLSNALAQRFDDVTLEVVGCVALFSGRVVSGLAQRQLRGLRRS